MAKTLKECQDWYDGLEPNDEEEDRMAQDEPNYYPEDRDYDFDS